MLEQAFLFLTFVADAGVQIEIFLGDILRTDVVLPHHAEPDHRATKASIRGAMLEHRYRLDASLTCRFDPARASRQTPTWL